MWDGANFSGTKIALLHRQSVIAYLRDDKPDIPFPGMWDLPGGGREGDEDPVTCALREVEEEFGLTLPSSCVAHLEKRPSRSPEGLANYFCVASIDDDHIADVRFGDEGQRWEMMTIENFIDHPDAVPDLQDRLRSYFGKQG